MNFGPVLDGTVELSPLTVFTGPNNAGKSFFATFAYAATIGAMMRYGYLRHFGDSSAVDLVYAPPHGTDIAGEAVRPDSATRRKLDDEARRLIARYRPGGSARASRPPKALVDAAQRAIDRAITAYGHQVLREIERCLGGHLEEVAGRSSPAGAVALQIVDSDIGWSVSLGTEKDLGSYARLSRSPNTDRLIIAAARRLSDEEELRDALSLAHEYAYIGYDEVREVTGPASLVIQSCIRDCFKSLPPFRYYLPAARSGILQSHRALATAVISRAPFAGLEAMDVPKLPGVVTDFLVRLLNLSQHRETPFAKVAEYLEGQVLDGRIELRQAKAGYPSISYESRRQRHPLERTSSMVSELAPVVLYLRYLLDPGELLIIEEPESHLHPSSQVRFARAVARIVDGGASVLLTTHSDYFLGQLNNLIRASALSRAEQRNVGIAVEDCLPPDCVGAYLFVNDRGRGSKIRPVEVSTADGITEAGLGEVAEALYDQTVTLQRSVSP